MTTIQMDDFLKRVKSYYPNFDNTDVAIIKEWKTYLKDKDFESANIQLDKYLGSEYNAYLPKPINLLRFAKKEGQADIGLNVKCEHCKAVMHLNEYEKHIERENRVAFMNKKARQYHFNDEFDTHKYMVMDEHELNDKYIKLLIKLLEVEEDEVQLLAIKNVLKTEHGGTIAYENNFVPKNNLETGERE